MEVEVGHAEDLAMLDELIATGRTHTFATCIHRRALPPGRFDDWFEPRDAPPRVRYSASWLERWSSWRTQVEVLVRVLLGDDSTDYKLLRRLMFVEAHNVPDRGFVERRDAIVARLEAVRFILVRRQAERGADSEHQLTRTSVPEAEPSKRAATVQRRARLARTINHAVTRGELRAEASAQEIQTWLKDIDGEDASNPRDVVECAKSYARLQLRTLQRDLLTLRSGVSPKSSA